MERLIIFILATSGLSWILVKSKLFRPYREYITLQYRESAKEIGSFNLFSYLRYRVLQIFNEVFNCIGCIGFHSGVLNYLLLYSVCDYNILCFGFMGSMVSLLVVSLYEFLNKR
jgi:hypothetical protein